MYQDPRFRIFITQAQKPSGLAMFFLLCVMVAALIFVFVVGSGLLLGALLVGGIGFIGLWLMQNLSRFFGKKDNTGIIEHE